MKTQIVYTLHATKDFLFMEECWVSAYSLRLYHPEAIVSLIIDRETNDYIREFSEFCNLFTKIVVVDVPERYSRKEKSRELKTKSRLYVDGPMLFLDNDTVICKRLDEIDKLSCDMAAVPETHLPLGQMPFSPLDSVEKAFGLDASDSEFYFNSGVIYVADNERTRQFFKKWNENWTYSCFKKDISQDEPAFLKTNRDFGNIIQELSGIYNAQIQMSLKYFADATIIHWWHMNFIEDQSYSPYFSKEIYKKIRKEGIITEEIATMIKNAKQSFASPTMPVGIDQIYFLFSPSGRIFSTIYKNGGLASALMLKISVIFDKIFRITNHRR